MPDFKVLLPPYPNPDPGLEGQGKQLPPQDRASDPRTGEVWDSSSSAYSLCDLGLSFPTPQLPICEKRA